jgi:hypothetical protein
MVREMQLGTPEAQRIELTKSLIPCNRAITMVGMTSYSAMAARGRETAREHTTGRRKRKVADIRLVREGGPYRIEVWEAVGECGHVLRRSRSPLVINGLVGRRITCRDEACRIPEKPPVPDPERCEYIMGAEVERRCATRARYDSDMGKVCTRHYHHYVREGYLDESEGTRL